MGKILVSIVKYEKPLDSVRKAVDLSYGLDHLPANARVFIKPNFVREMYVPGAQRKSGHPGNDRHKRMPAQA